MRWIRKGLALLLALGIPMSGATAAAQDRADTAAGPFTNISADALEMKQLEEPGKDKIALCVNGKTDFTVVLPEVCSEALLHAVETLQNVFKQMTGAELPAIREPEKNASKHCICIDTAMDTARPEAADVGDGYHMAVSEGGVSVCGATQAGTANGIYAFLEDVLGCMFLTPEDTYIPGRKTVWLEKFDKTVKPATQWRDVYAYETVQGDWASKLRLNGIDKTAADSDSATIEELQYAGWGTWCHDCYQYLSPEDYYETHPEYFSEKNGKRVAVYKDRDAYLCLSNPEVFEIVKNALAKKIAENPEKQYWDFSGNDNPALAGCACDACKAADKAAGGTGMGTLLPFLNKLAKAFPDKYISTLAYLHTLKAPENMKAEPNVVIKLCAMPGDQAVSYLDGTNSNSAQFKEQVEEWSKITDHIVIWDYVVNFSHLLLPFPNFSVQADNQKFYENNHVMGVFHQASREKGGEFACLRAYVLSRLMWEGSGMDVAQCVSKYVAAYFGKAAESIIAYMNMCDQALYASGKPLGLYDGLIAHYNGYLSQENIQQYQKQIEAAKAAVAGDAELLSRVEEAELSVAYAAVLLPNISSTERQALLDQINLLCAKFEITMVCEWDSLENFNQGSLDSTISNEKKELAKPYCIAVGLAAGVALLAGVIVWLHKRRKKREAVKART